MGITPDSSTHTCCDLLPFSSDSLCEETQGGAAHSLTRVYLASRGKVRTDDDVNFVDGNCWLRYTDNRYCYDHTR